ncbi:MAG: polysulfide reductase NrfD [Deltaproteobacteria bacterium]|nr:polysulfide reductase NrfD [Deltaproteobacteria bacterium]
MATMVLFVLIGASAYFGQVTDGLIRTGMRDQVSWGFYIGNFTFLVGVAAAAVVLVIPAYIYDWKPIKEIVLIGELLAISAIIMCIAFVMVDVGRPERTWHFLLPNFPRSLLAWDVLVLNGYLAINALVAFHIMYRGYFGKPYNKKWVLPLVLLSVPAAVSIHTVTAFLYSGLAARSYWNTAILAPRFLTSAFCSGPAIILILLQILRRYWKFDIKDEALHKIAELMAYAMFINLFLLGAEIYREYYSDTHHLIHHEYLFSGLHGHMSPVAPYAWASVIASTVAFLLFLIPKTRKNFLTLNIGAVLIYFGVYVEKGIALVIPGFTPSMLGEVYEYAPSFTELQVAMGVFGVGAIVFTALLKTALPVLRPEDAVGPAAEAAAEASA